MKKRMIIIPIAVILLFLAMSSVVVTKPGEYRVIKQFGKIVRVEENDGSSYGVSWKIPFIQSETVISSKMKLSDLPVSDVMTSDKKSMIADCFVMWKIEDPVKFIQKLSGSVQNAESRISSNVYNALKNVISSLSQEEVISGRDGELAQILTESLGTNLETYGIKVQKIETKMLDLPDENKDAVYNRMISERNNIAASYTAQGEQQAQEIKNDTNEKVTVLIARAEKQAATLVAEGEAEYMRILSEAYNDESKADFYGFVRQLDAVKATLKNGDNTIVLDKDSPIAELFYE
ncbi:MAG: protease modulator HflC [Lachnospiraceae bacterium]|nr:protease modulator HflC [Lachnospiraceae bacterium]MEE1014846.1 protease modulator HflC [Lachnospiraceae bacterium]